MPTSARRLCALGRGLFRPTRFLFWPLGCFVLALAAVVPAHAMRIVVTNDDGFECRNLQALFTALRAAGHDVVLSAPYSDMSGSSALLGSLSDQGRTDAPSPEGTVPAGSPRAGPTTIAENQYYVDSTPVAAALYALDVVAPAKWGAAPDLVISGPNRGNNLGITLPHSGTVGAAVAALNRGVPALAVSGANDDAATAALLAQITLRVIAAITDHGKITLPSGTGLNVNVPPLDARRSAASYRCVFTQVGRNSNVSFRFASDSVAQGALLPLPVDNSSSSETNAFADGNTVTVSPIQGTYQASSEAAALVLTQMRPLFDSPPLAAALVSTTTGGAPPLTAAVTVASKLINISMRGFVGTGASVQVAGFVLSGSSPKTVLIRGSGPALANLGVQGALADPAVDLFDSGNHVVASNDNWGDTPITAAIAAAAARIGAFAWQAGSKDAALLVTLAPGAYSVVLRGVGDATGVGLLEVYDVELN